MNYFSPQPRNTQPSPLTNSPASNVQLKQEAALPTVPSSPVVSNQQATEAQKSTKEPPKTPQQSRIDPTIRRMPQDSPRTPQQARIEPSTRENTYTPKTPQQFRPDSSGRKMPDTPTTPRNIPAPNDDDIPHAHLKYKFLYPPMRRDINKRAPDDPDYDEKTLFVPDSFLNAQTPAMRQWWLIKQKNMDSILFFKMGKFYELFNEDAVIGVNNLDIMYMKGDETKPAHAGFPEISFSKYANILINKGFKVLRIEQTETPAMMEERCQTTGQRSKFDKVVRREICQVTTKGTQMMGVSDSVFHSSQNQYLLAICESIQETDEKRLTVFGVCFVDVTIGKVHIGQFADDHNLSKLNILLAHHTPTEILYQRGNLSQHSYQAILKTGALLTPLKAKKEFWEIRRAFSHLKTHRIFLNERGDFEWPQELRNLFECEAEVNLVSSEPKDIYAHGLNSFAAIVYYLNAQLIEGQVLKCAQFEIYQTPLERITKSSCLPAPGESKSASTVPPMIIDHIALKNLEIFMDSSGGTSSTLFDSINHCKTHFGQRLLKNWICSPLCDITQIENRLDAVEALTDNCNVSLMNEIVHVLGQTPDLERLLSKIKSQCFKSESDTRAVMFDGDQYSKAKINSFLNLLTNFKRLQKFIHSVKRTAQNCESQVLKRLLSFTTDDGLYPDYSSTLEYFENSFDHKAAQQTGKIVPSQGVDRDYDECDSNIRLMKSKLDDYLEEQKSVLRCRNIEFFGTAKNRFQIQVPEPQCNSVPDEYRIETARKGYKRYYTPTIDKYFSKLTTYEEEMKRILDNTMSKIFEQFTRKMKLWSAAIECVAILDVLQSIASFVRSLKANGVDMCRPRFIANSHSPLIDYKNGRHPALVKSNPNFIPNDLVLDDKLILLSGANMGGKSTLMRQTALIVILAQIGCPVPASSLQLTPVDRIFSRLGASDRLLEGESTFYTELVETSTMLRCASKHSLLLLDELGRGTSTFDGTAIAYSVIREISMNLKCRCLFSTHYHSLTRDFTTSDNVRLAHMACKIERQDTHDEISLDPLKENLSFLYKITEGPASRSYGFNVAKLAGIKDEIIRNALVKAKEIETGCKILGALQKVTIADVNSPRGDDLKRKVMAQLECS